jgi:hypothetical protein
MENMNHPPQVVEKSGVMPLSPEEREELKRARQLLEHPSLTARLTDIIGTPVEKGLKLLPANWKKPVHFASEKALRAALFMAVSTLGREPGGSPSPKLHKFFGAVSGAAGGAFGLPALAVELPLSTTIMFRSVADIARFNGEDLSAVEAKLACLQVFALGSPTTTADDGSESGYFTVRAGLAQLVGDAAQHIAKHGLADQSAPALVRLISKLAARFSIPVSEKLAAQAIPVVGAAGGALVNTLFMDHFQDISQGHFTVRRLERIHGAAVVRAAWEDLAG